MHAPLVHDANRQPEYRNNTETAIYGYSEGVEHALDTVWAKGYRQPRTITTIEELVAADESTVVRSYFGNVYVKDTDLDDEKNTWWTAPGTDHQYPNNRVALPAVVLWTPGDLE